MPTLFRILIVMLVTLVLSDVGHAARKKNRMKISFTGKEAAPAPTKLRIGSQHDGMISVRASSPKKAASARRNFITQTDQEPEIQGGSDDSIEGEFGALEEKRVRVVTPVKVQESPRVSSSSVSATDSSIQTRTRFSRRTMGRSGVTLIPALGVSSSGISYSGESDGMEMSSTARGYAFTGGLMLELGRSLVSFETGVLYMQESYSARGTSREGGFTSTTNYKNGSLSYVGVPLAARVNLARSENTRVHIKGGIIPAVLIGNYFEYDTVASDGFGSWNKSGSYSGTSDMNMMNVFLLAGGGIDFALSSGNDIRLESTYRRTLMPIGTAGSAVVDSILLTAGFGIDL
ncbi:MAG: outer membrane beta-barrel protein [Bdellovibrionota bacterium]